MTNAELAILSLIAQQPCYGYEIEKIIKERNMREWTEIGFSSIYYLLNKLELKGCLKAEQHRQRGQGPARKIYQITKTGLCDLKEGITQALSTPNSVESNLLLGLANLPYLSKEESIDAMQLYAHKLVDKKIQIQKKLSQAAPMPYFVAGMFEYSLKMIETELEWMTNFVTQLEENYGNI